MKNITCREKLKREIPENIDDAFYGGCYGCPHIYEYAKRPIWCKFNGSYENCTKCWDRPVGDKGMNYEDINVETQEVIVRVEEHLCKELKIQVPRNLSSDEAMEKAEEIVKSMIDDELLVLTADDWNGIRLCETETEDGSVTEWHDL